MYKLKLCISNTKNKDKKLEQVNRSNELNNHNNNKEKYSKECTVDILLKSIVVRI